MKFPKPQARISDPGHLRRVADLSCCACNRFHDVVAHHLLRAPGKSLARKAGDNYVVPLCNVCHDSVHRHGGETKWFAEREIFDPVGMAELLYKHTKDYDTMYDIVTRRFR